MKANELRVGNLVLGASRGEVVTVTGLMIEQLERGLLNIGPIQLTEEWLLRSGFQDGYLFDSYDNSIEVDLKNHTVYVSGNEACITAHCYPAKIQYVHQLQNLYFALTGEELTIDG